MKTLIIIALLFISTPLLYAGNGGDSSNIETNNYLQRDLMVSVTADYVESNVYVNLKMLNESKGGFYSLIKEYPDGSFESVELREINVNTINSPLLYSFIDEEVPEVNVTYVLYRISIESEEIQRWQYCTEQKKLCPNLCFVSN